MKINNRFNSLVLVAFLSNAGLATPLARAVTSPTDPEIATIVHSVNQVDIDASKLAKSKTRNSKVKEFANMMIDGHRASQKQIADLTASLGVTLDPSEDSRSLDTSGKENLKNLQSLEGAAFDKAYIDQEVSFHQTVADSISQTLIPNARNKELKDLLEQTLSVVRAHLENAKTIQASLNQNG